MKKHSLKWFTDRIGKRIYRLNGPGKECCVHCGKAKQQGVYIRGSDHAFEFWIWQDTGHRYADKPKS